MDRLLLFLAVLPAILLGRYIYKNDRLEKEPKSLLVGLTLAGVGAIVLTLLITWGLGVIVPFFASEYYTSFDHLSLALYVFVGIALIEEFSKWIFIYLIAWNNKEFNHVYDAIVYSVFASLGFAAIENILYVFSSSNYATAFFTAFNRMIFSVPGHAFFGVFMGYYLGLAKLTGFNGIKTKSAKYLFFSILIPTICHFFFDYLLMLNIEYSFLLFLLFVVIMFSIAILKVKRLSNVNTNIFNKPIPMNYINNMYLNYNQINQNINYQRKYCYNCGNPISSGQYCANCGVKV